MTTSLLTERCLSVWTSPAGKRHVGGWFGTVLCGAFVDSHNGWRYIEEVSVKYLASIAQYGYDRNWCKRCLNNYKDVILDA